MMKIMSDDPFHNSTSTKLGDEQLVIWTYINILLSIFAMIINLYWFAIIGSNGPVSATYHIQRIDSLITALSQFGIIGHHLGSIDIFRNKFCCTVATSLCIVSVLHPIMSWLYLVIIP